MPIMIRANYPDIFDQRLPALGGKRTGRRKPARRKPPRLARRKKR